MKIEVVDKRKPELKAGQLWKRGSDIYLSIANATSEKGISLMLATTVGAFGTSWSHNRGFGINDNEFEYLGELKITP